MMRETNLAIDYDVANVEELRDIVRGMSPNPSDEEILALSRYFLEKDREDYLELAR